MFDIAEENCENKLEIKDRRRIDKPSKNTEIHYKYFLQFFSKPNSFKHFLFQEETKVLLMLSSLFYPYNHNFKN